MASCSENVRQLEELKIIVRFVRRQLEQAANGEGIPAAKCGRLLTAIDTDIRAKKIDFEGL